MAKAPSLREDRSKGPQRTRKLSTVYSVYAGEMSRDASWAPPWRRTAGVEPSAVKAARTVLNGGDEETGMVRRALSLPNYVAPAFGSGSRPALARHFKGYA
jgi:hypothetical protein